MEQIEDKINVYIKTNESYEVVEIISQDFIMDVADYILIDSGYGDKFRHAQSQYLDSDLIGDDGYNYIYDKNSNKIVKKLRPKQ